MEQFEQTMQAGPLGCPTSHGSYLYVHGSLSIQCTVCELVLIQGFILSLFDVIPENSVISNRSLFFKGGGSSIL